MIKHTIYLVLAIFTAIQSVSGQTEAVKYNTATGIVPTPGAGAKPILSEMDNVIYVSKSASATDTRTGLNIYDASSPFATIGAAITAASAGDTVAVLPGTYSESVTAVNGVDLYGTPGATVSSASGTALSVPTGVSCVVAGSFDFVSGTSSTSPVVSLTGTGDVVFSANSVLHEATVITTNETGIYTTKATAKIYVAKESRSVAYDGVWIDGGTDVYVSMPLSTGGDNGVEVTGGVSVLLDVRTITGEAGTGLNLMDGGGGSITSLVLRVVDAQISSVQNRGVGVYPSTDDYLSVTLQGCVVVIPSGNSNTAVHINQGVGVTGRIILRDTLIRDDSIAFATYSIESNAPIELDGVAVDLPIEGTVTYSGSYTAPGGTLTGGGLGTAAYVNTGTGATNVPTTTDADGRYIRLSTAQTVTGTKSTSGAGTAWYAGTGTNRAGLRVHPNGTNAFVVWEDTSQSSGNRNWDTIALGTALQYRLSSDDYGAAALYYQVVRSGVTATSHTWYTDASVSRMTLNTASGHQAQGTTTNNAAAAGWQGEQIASTVAVGSAVSLTTGTPANVTSISLTAGDWDVSGTVYYNHAATTTATYYTAGIGSTSATLPGYAGAQVSIPASGVAVTNYTPSAAISPTRVSLASTTTYYLVAQSEFAVDTLAAYGHLRARRMR